MNRFFRATIILSLIGAIFISGYTYLMLSWSYAEGGEGWLCSEVFEAWLVL